MFFSSKRASSKRQEQKKILTEQCQETTADH